MAMTNCKVHMWKWELWWYEEHGTSLGTKSEVVCFIQIVLCVEMDDRAINNESTSLEGETFVIINAK